MPDHDRFMREAIAEGAKGGAEGNAAVGSVIVRGDAVVGRGRNTVAATLDPTAHAEMVALRDAAPALGTDNLTGCTLYTTWEPCPMCCGAIMYAGVSTLVVGARTAPEGRRFGAYTVEWLVEQTKWDDRLSIVTEVLHKECADLRWDWEAKNKAKA